MNLYSDKIINVDLTHRKITIEPLRQEWIKKYWGCWGLATRYFFDLVPPTVNPFSPENALVIMTGPLCGTLAPLASRFCFVSKSPHTGTIFESNCGGSFGPELKFAGFDGIIITGRADNLVYLKIEDNKLSLENASFLEGKGIFETEDLLKETEGNQEVKTLSIGPAGENLISFACIGSDSYRQLGRGGCGALFGSKNLKAIVCKGTGGINIAGMADFNQKVSHYKETDLFTDDNLWAKTDGTPVLVDLTNEMGIHPTRNFTYGVNEDRTSLNSDAIKKVKLNDRACASCPMACGNFTRINNAEVEGPEYETLCIAGSNCGINNMEDVIKFNSICDDLGLDTISCGSTIAVAMEMTEAGRQNFELKFGEASEYLEVVHEIANLTTARGKDLALGAKKLAEKYKAEDLITESKGLELPAYEPRGNYGMGLAYATSERGACHLRAFTIFDEDPFDTQALTMSVIEMQNANAIKWCMCFCDFWGTINTDIMADLLTAGLGEEIKAEELDKAGERVWNLSRIFNLRAGITAAADTLSTRIIKQALQKGPHDGKVFDRASLEKMKSAYYQIRGWDENGVPTKEKLVQLGLEGL
jgi:aldehyde:ferredoxin oxidoreductase